MFCPFIKGECNPNCIYYGGYYDVGDSENCDLYDAVKTLQSLRYENNQIDIRQKEILDQLSSIENNTSSNQSDSSSIRSTVDDIMDFLKKYEKS